MSIKIPVEANFDPSKMEAQLQQFRQQLNALGQQIAQANKTQFNPVGKTTVDDLKKVNAQFETLLKIHTSLNNRIKASGQQGSGFLGLDWAKLYSDPNSRAKQMAKAFEYVTGQGFHAAVPPVPGHNPAPPPPPPPRRPTGPSAGGIITGAIQSGLGAANGVTGGVSGVASQALGTGMSAGFGAGLMGLLGGMLALGVGKLVGAATEKLDEAQANSVTYDRLKRVLGDVGVSFAALKGEVEGASRNLKLTFAETAKLGTEFARLGNLTAEQSRGLFLPGGHLDTSVGMARAFGLDPGQTTGVFGQMRGAGLTRSESDTRRFALMIGETIGKSGAFAKADEVMDALANYANSQVRNNLGPVNVAGYAGLFSGMVGSGIPGLDPQGAGALISRVNSAIAAGGAKGEASQFFTGVVGARLGLDPIQTQMMREGGAFATKDSTFGPGSVWSRFMGRNGPGGGMTMLQAQLGDLRRQYGSNKGLLAQATANHLGVNLGQAMALHLIQPNQMGEMQKYADITKLSSSGIGNLSKALYGSAADRSALADSLRRRTGAGALSSSERSDLDRAMGGSDTEQRRVLAMLVATRDQEATQGSDIRDSKNLLDNIKTSIADKLVPLTQEIRHGIIYLAGEGGKVSSRKIMETVLDSEHNDRRSAIDADFDSKRKALNARRGQLRDQMNDLSDENLQERYRGQPEMIRQKLEERRRLSEEFNEYERKLIALQEEKAKLITEENERHKRALDDMRKAEQDRLKADSGGAGGGGGSGASLPSVGGGGGGGGAAIYTSGLFGSVIQQESGGRHYDRYGNVLTSSAGARGIAQLMPGTARNPGFGITPVQDESPEENMRVGREYLNALIQYYGGDVRKALAAYNGGMARVNRAVRRYGDNWLAGMPAETRRYVPSVLNRHNRGTPLPRSSDQAERGDNMRIRVDPLEVIHRNDRGEQIGMQHLATRLSPASPFGTERYS